MTIGQTGGRKGGRPEVHQIMRENLLYLAAGVLGMGAVALAQETDTANGGNANIFMSCLINIIPWILVIVFIWLFVFKGLKGTQAHQERLMLHMERIEQKYDRIIQLLERLVDEQRRDEDLEGSQDEPVKHNARGVDL